MIEPPRPMAQGLPRTWPRPGGCGLYSGWTWVPRNRAYLDVGERGVGFAGADRSKKAVGSASDPVRCGLDGDSSEPAFAGGVLGSAETASATIFRGNAELLRR